jgi:glycerol-3-phosphate acyltransferase PlsY
VIQDVLAVARQVRKIARPMNLHPATIVILSAAASYIIGATPFGMIISRLKGVDLRKSGSGNIGATNVGRVLGRRWGYLCFLLDLAKGLAPVVAAGMISDFAGMSFLLKQFVWLAAGLGAILGHVFTFWLAFRGGKGVATALGVVLGVFPYLTLPGLAAFGIWIAVTLITRYVSVGSIAAALAFAPLFVVMNYRTIGELAPLATFAGLMILLILARHLTNMRRLLAGVENKIGSKAGR